MQLRQEVGNGVGVLSVSGPVSSADMTLLQSEVLAGLDRGAGVVVDLGGVRVLSPAAVQALCALTGDCWPAPGVRVCGARWDGAPSYWTGDLGTAMLHLDASGTGFRQRLVLEASPTAPGQGRAAALSFLHRLGLGHVADDVVLVVSEMVTNAVRHGTGPVTLELERDTQAVVVGVRDESPEQPVARQADADAEGGRGLELVDLLCVAHGVRSSPPGKTVWGALRTP